LITFLFRAILGSITKPDLLLINLDLFCTREDVKIVMKCTSAYIVEYVRYFKLWVLLY